MVGFIDGAFVGGFVVGSSVGDVVGGLVGPGVSVASDTVESSWVLSSSTYSTPVVSAA